MKWIFTVSFWFPLQTIQSKKSNSDFTTRTYKKVSNGNHQFLLKCRSSYRLRLIGNSFFLFWEILHFNFLNKSMGTSIK
ncbi:hypothetical protein LEP1GSC161_2481 [Leptospira santarosai str. CBC1416]|uniref:Uncharacterized protein n=1 Tax=Leptospira santarosai str. CBC1416 TaxID=1193059 RepID=M6W554_9LEPT|nr:hypothetical protein LEP1GSC168_1204 [Leptospira santarosai str. HAI134]EMO56903.1 hypothetical protein LEP1GSC161_2481 [Leptospira santarosai str. CBC1416]EMP82294.1 hypothetical protein LEP1GSC162_0035 [Leptospira santarosai str. CBC1531]